MSVCQCLYKCVSELEKIFIRYKKRNTRIYKENINSVATQIAEFGLTAWLSWTGLPGKMKNDDRQCVATEISQNVPVTCVAILCW